MNKVLIEDNCTILLPAQRQAFAELKIFLTAAADELYIPDEIKKILLISADEIFTNIASYAYPDRAGNVICSFKFSSAEQMFEMTFTDRGILFNPLDVPLPNPDEQKTQKNSGGFGLLLVKNLMDSMEYRRQEGKNILTVKKKIPERVKKT